VGDKVSISYEKAEDGIADMTRFDNHSIGGSQKTKE